MARFDAIVLTAANESQAAGYRTQLEHRKSCGLLDPSIRIFVIADPGNRRVGSFGATLNVLSALRREGALAENRRVLLCHSGGDGRRTPAYAAQGKAFTPVPCRDAAGNPLALFDMILRNSSRLALGSGVLVASGDVAPTFGDADIPSMDFSLPGVIGAAYLDSVERGSRHGVYVPGPAPVQGASALHDVSDFLQKPKPEVAKAAGAVTDSGCVAVDTGLVAIDAETCLRLAGLADGGILASIVDGSCPQMDFYEEFLMALVPSIDEDSYLSRFATRRGCDATHLNRLRTIRDTLHGIPFRVNVAAECDFFHLGSSRELLGGFLADGLASRSFGFAAESEPGSAAFVFNSRLGTVESRGPSLVEGVCFDGTLRLGGGNIVTGFPQGMGEGRIAIDLPEGIGIVAMPIGSAEWATVAYGVRDDFKTAYGGIAPCLFLNESVDRWIEARGLSAADLWTGDEGAGMWTARLWRVGTLGETVAEAVAAAGGVVEGGAQARQWDDWRGARRFSMSELVAMVNHRRLSALCAESLGN